MYYKILIVNRCVKENYNSGESIEIEMYIRKHSVYLLHALRSL